MNGSSVEHRAGTGGTERDLAPLAGGHHSSPLSLFISPAPGEAGPQLPAQQREKPPEASAPLLLDAPARETGLPPTPRSGVQLSIAPGLRPALISPNGETWCVVGGYSPELQQTVTAVERPAKCAFPLPPLLTDTPFSRRHVPI
ncbi:hypothetical protein AAFF_G00354030 [Aldrovandia affinis]|uniref:Uncharacterized protein n=1 Tax=Aldrovandia affinis TaxID=143900 RepID=A0AAD7SIE9_9TELE|nr:hypothetical protein AAFF_G00354030 [Aldrovandia affinis]